MYLITLNNFDTSQKVFSLLRIRISAPNIQLFYYLISSVKFSVYRTEVKKCV